MHLQELSTLELDLVSGGGIVVGSRSETGEGRGVIVSGEDDGGDDPSRGVIFGD